MIQAAIFDMDGVLIDSQMLHYQADIAAIEKAGKKARLSDVSPYAGVTTRDRLTAYKNNFDLPQPLDTLLGWQIALLMDAFHREKLAPIDGIPALLAHIKKFNLKTAVASSSSHALIELVLAKTGLAAFFDELVSGENVKRGKPAPDVFLRAAEMLGVPPENCVVIEDSPSGIEAAKNAGMLCVAYRGPDAPDENRAGAARKHTPFSAADYVITRYEECYGLFA